jgi:hypothetical protein
MPNWGGGGGHIWYPNIRRKDILPNGHFADGQFAENRDVQFRSHPRLPTLFIKLFGTVIQLSCGSLISAANHIDSLYIDFYLNIHESCYSQL